MQTQPPKTREFFFQPVADFIKQFETPTSGQFGPESDALSDLQAGFKLVDRAFTTEFVMNIHRSGLNGFPTFKKIQFTTNKPLEFEEISINNFGFGSDEDGTQRLSYSASVSTLQSDGLDLDKPYYYRLVIPTQDKLDFDFKLDIGYISSDRGMVKGMPVNVDGSGFHLNRVSAGDDESLNLLVISCDSLSTWHQFQKQSYSILVGLGYATGHFIADRGYYFAYSVPSQQDIIHFRYSALRTSIKSDYYPVYALARTYITKDDELVERMQPQLRPVSRPEFDTLCQLINNSVDFESVCLLILEASSGSLFPMATGLAVVLETLAKLIIPPNAPKALPPIEDKELADKLRKALTEAFEKICPGLPEDSRNPIIARINQINQKTNQASLRAPFDYLNINLSAADLRVLNSRNDLLHGRLPNFSGSKMPDINQMNSDLAYAAWGLYTLTNALVLKRIAFSSRMINYPKIYESFTNIPLEEDHFRQL